MAAFYGGIFGVCFASYGNQIFGQFPTGSVMYMSMVYIFLAENFIEKRSLKRSKENSNDELSIGLNR
jgi:hypothetical protein